MSLYFVGPKHPSGSCYVSCFLTDSTALIELQVQCMKIASSEHIVYINCSKCQNKNQFVYTTFSELAIYMYWTRNSVVILWVSWCKSRSFLQRFTCTDAYADANSDKSANRGKILVWLSRLTVWYTQYPIIRNSLIRNASEIWGNFKKRLVSRSNLRNELKKLRNAHWSRFLG